MGKLLFWLYRVLLLVLLFWGAHAWPLWFLDALDPFSSIRVLVTIITVIISIAYSSVYVKGAFFHRRIIILFILLFLAFFHMYKGTWSVLMTLQYIPLFVMSEDTKYSGEHLIFLINTLCIILVPGIIIHTIGMVTDFPPSIPIAHSFSDNYIFFNYILDIVNISEGISIRFHSIFLEPGYLAAMCVGLLYARNFNFKEKTSWVLLIALFFTFSTLGYASFITTFIFQRFLLVKGTKKIASIFLFAIVVFVGYLIAKNYNGGDNPVNKRIIERIQISDDESLTDYRSGSVVNNLYDNMIVTGEIITGVGFGDIGNYFPDGKTNGNAGYKYFAVVHGIYTLVLFFAIYVILAPLHIKRGRKYFGWGGVLLGSMVFFSIGEPQTWFVIIPMVLGVNSYIEDKKIIYDKRVLKKIKPYEDRNFNVSLRT